MTGDKATFDNSANTMNVWVGVAPDEGDEGTYWGGLVKGGEKTTLDWKQVGAPTLDVPNFYYDMGWFAGQPLELDEHNCATIPAYISTEATVSFTPEEETEFRKDAVEAVYQHVQKGEGGALGQLGAREQQHRTKPEKIKIENDDPRFRDPTQIWTLVSILGPFKLKEEDEVPQYAVKVRGSYETLERAEKAATDLSKHDPYFDIQIIQTGTWFNIDTTQHPEEKVSKYYPHNETLDKIMSRFRSDEQANKDAFEIRVNQQKEALAAHKEELLHRYERKLRDEAAARKRKTKKKGKTKKKERGMEEID